MKKIIVTGASKGIGYATSLSLASMGHKVLAIARSEDLLHKLVNESTSENIIALPVDISSNSGRDELIELINEQKSFDALINNAAILINKSFKELTLDEWRHQFEVNFFSIVDLIKSCLPYFKDGAHIVNIGSMAGFQGAQKFKGLSAYGAGKAALASLTEALAVELIDQNIHVNCLALGAVSTDMQQNAFPNLDPIITSEMMGEYIANFTTNEGKLFNGKVIPVALNNPS
jgi:NAD(P)-dependent dehydrogenase (short-subunit alcohol dehydrogenase family)